jgi:hypothetical protein
MAIQSREEPISLPETVSVADELAKPRDSHVRIDPEVAKYATSDGVEVSEADNKRLKRMIDKRVLTVMVFTYFLQALDKGTLSFAAIMNLREDLNLHGQQVHIPAHVNRDLTAIVLVVDNMYLPRRPCRRVSDQPADSTATRRQIPQHQHHALGSHTCDPRRLQELHLDSHRSNVSWCIRSRLPARILDHEQHVVQARRAGLHRDILVHDERGPANRRGSPGILFLVDPHWPNQGVPGPLPHLRAVLGHLGWVCLRVASGLAYEGKVLLRGGQEVDGGACSRKPDWSAKQEMAPGAVCRGTH